MYPKQNSIFRQQGSMLVISLFVIVVGGLLGVTMVRLLSASSQAVIYEVTGQRALNAANSGLQRAITSAFPIGAPVAECNTAFSSDASFSQISGLQNCRYDAQCTTTEITVEGESRSYYRFSSTGSCESGDAIVSRTVAVDAVQQE